MNGCAQQVWQQGKKLETVPWRRRLEEKNGQRCQDGALYFLACRRTGKGQECRCLPLALPRRYGLLASAKRTRTWGGIPSASVCTSAPPGLGQLSAESSWELGAGRRAQLVKERDKCVRAFLVNSARFSESMSWHFMPCCRFFLVSQTPRTSKSLTAAMS